MYRSQPRSEADPGWIPPPRLYAPEPPRRRVYRDSSPGWSVPSRLQPQTRAPHRRPAAPELTHTQREIRALRRHVAPLEAKLAATAPTGVPIAETPEPHHAPTVVPIAVALPTVNEPTPVPAAEPSTTRREPTTMPTAAALPLLGAPKMVPVAPKSAPAPDVVPTPRPEPYLVIMEVPRVGPKADVEFLLTTERRLPLAPPSSKRGRFDSKGGRMMRSWPAIRWFTKRLSQPRPWRPPWSST